MNYKWVQKRGEAMKLLMDRESLQYFLCCAVLGLAAQSCSTLCNPMDCIALQAPPSMGFSSQEYWSESLPDLC